MRSVNENLFAINQAKSRINAARAAGETPDAADLALVATEKQKAYAIAQYAEVMTIEKFAKHIASHGCVYSKADISAVLNMAVDCMREQLLEGRKIRLGALGDFSVSLTSNGADTAEKFSAQNITAVKVNWECGADFRDLIAEAEFQLVAPRAAQAAVLKAIKAGESTVNLNTTDTTEDAGSDGESGSGSDAGSGGSGSSDSGSGSGSGSSSSVSGSGSSDSGSGSSDSGSGSGSGGSGSSDGGSDAGGDGGSSSGSGGGDE